MGSGMIIIFVAIIVGACIVGGAVYSGLMKVAEAINGTNSGNA